MKIRWFKSLSRESRHPLLEELLLYLDGEAEAKRARDIRRHLESCWTCRGRREKIGRVINDLTEFDSAAAPRPSAPSQEARNRFLLALKPLTGDPNQPPFLCRIVRGLPGEVRGRVVFQPALTRFLIAAIAVGLITVVGLFLNRESIVSAHELIEQATKAEEQLLYKTHQPVIYQKIYANRIGDPSGKDRPGITLEIWRDIGKQRMQRRVNGNGGALFSELERILRASGRQSPLSISEFSAWRNAAQIETESVSKVVSPDGGGALRLFTVVASPYTANQIVESELVVRARDWHPVSERLKARTSTGTEEFEFTEATYEVMALGDLNPAIFNDAARPSEQLRTLIKPGSPSPTATVATVPGRPSAAELAAAEFDARYRLHQLRADLEGNLQIESTATGVLVSGIVDTAARKEELISVLGSIALVSLNIQTIDEATRALASPRSVAAPTAEIVTPLAAEGEKNSDDSRRNSLQRLARHFERQLATSDVARINAAVAQFSNEAVSLCTSALAEAWAMRRLAERYSASDQTTLSPADRRRLDRMIVTHAQRIGAHTRRLQLLLSPIVKELSGNSAQSVSGSDAESASSANDWGGRTQAIFNEVRKLDGFTAELLFGSKEDASGGSIARSLLATFPRLLAHLENVEESLRSPDGPLKK
jgi:hypothetical protein